LREIAGAERRFLDWRPAVFVLREPLRQRHCDVRRIPAFVAALIRRDIAFGCSTSQARLRFG
jgi:hypothetical protein